MGKKTYDFGGWASKYGVLCSDGVTIMPGAFAEQDGREVPIVWGHDHSGPRAILGKAYIEHREEGPYIWGSFNDTEDGQYAKAAVNHGDIKYLSVFADHLTKHLGNISKATLKEVSLVPFGAANPGAYIDQAVLAHSDGTYGIVEDQAFISSGEEIELNVEYIEHADDEETETKEEKKVAKEEEAKKKPDKERTVEDVLNEMTDEQLAVVNYIKEQAMKLARGSEPEDDDEDEDEDEVEHDDYEGDDTHMKYNAFENAAGKQQENGVLTHSDQVNILNMAKDGRHGTFKQALKSYLEENDFIAHADGDDLPTSMGVGGFDDTTTIGPENYYTSFTSILPEFKEVNGMNPPQLVTPEWGWVDVVMNKTHKSPISRIRTSYIDIREIEENLRAKGYQKGHFKTLTGQLKIARRTTDPQTIYVKNELHRDDIIDITDFDYVQYLYNIDRQMYNVELATAILFGDGREDSDPDKIFPEHIRPVWTDDDLYTIHYDMSEERSNIQGSNTSGYFGANYVEAEAMVNACLYASETYKGTGTPDMFIEQHKLNVMLLARDRNGRRIYESKQQLATALGVGGIYVCEKMKDKVRTVGEGASAKEMKLVCLLVNLSDYHVGATKGGQVTHFTQFDIDFNKEKSLLEGRCSGALTKLYSAIVIEEEVTKSNP